MVSTLVSDTRDTRFNSRCLQILLTSFFLMCQVLSKTNFPCMYKKNYIYTFTMCQVLSETNFPCISTSNFPCKSTKKLCKLFLKTLPRLLLPAFGRPLRQAGAARWDKIFYLSNYIEFTSIAT